MLPLDALEHPLREWDSSISFPDEPVVLPAFVLGYELQRAIGEQRPKAPSWLVELAHQYGGYACLQTTIVGAFLPLAENRAMAKRDTAKLESALHVMSDDFDGQPAFVRTALADFAALAEIRETAGGSLNGPQRITLEALIQPHFDVPHLAQSHEALLRFDAVDLAAFYGFRARNFSTPLPTERFDAAKPGGSILFDADAAEQLVDSGKRLGHPLPPSLFLLWNNSD